MLHVGTSGWSYAEWKPDFYPPDVPRKDFLAYYGTRLSACEINATFYRDQERNVVERWAKAVPNAFRFAMKAHRTLTYGLSIAPDDARRDRLTTFLEQVSWLGAKRGPILFQLPPYRKLDLPALRALLARLPDGALPAFEFRDPSWDQHEVVATIADAGGTICYSDVGAAVPDGLPAGPCAYVRLRAERYPRDKRAAWRKLLEREAAGRDVYVFTKHEGVAVEDSSGGVGLALWLERYARAQPIRAGEPARSTSNQTAVT
jgi:uncharacterized protein YecE (DUF72 family)